MDSGRRLQVNIPADTVITLPPLRHGDQLSYYWDAIGTCRYVELIREIEDCCERREHGIRQRISAEVMMQSDDAISVAISLLDDALDYHRAESLEGIMVEIDGEKRDLGEMLRGSDVSRA